MVQIYEIRYRVTLGGQRTQEVNGMGLFALNNGNTCGVYGTVTEHNNSITIVEAGDAMIF